MDPLSKPNQIRRLHEPHRQPPSPKLFKLPNRYEIKRLLMLLDSDDVDLRSMTKEFGREPGMQEYVLAYSNFVSRSKEKRIQSPFHACAMLGTSGLERMLTELLTAPLEQSA